MSFWWRHWFSAGRRSLRLFFFSSIVSTFSVAVDEQSTQSKEIGIKRGLDDPVAGDTVSTPPVVSSHFRTNTQAGIVLSEKDRQEHDRLTNVTNQAEIRSVRDARIGGGCSDSYAIRSRRCSSQQCTGHHQRGSSREPQNLHE